MEAFSKLIACSLFLGLLLSCSGQTDQAENSVPNAESTAPSGSIKTEVIGNLVDGYLKLKDALVASEEQEAQQYAVALLEVVDADAVPDIQQTVKEMAATTDLEEQRRLFEGFSVQLYQHLKDSEGLSQTLYKQYCPMAFNDQGAYWLSAQEEIRNPYFGDEMLKCGNVQEVLTAN